MQQLKIIVEKVPQWLWPILWDFRESWLDRERPTRKPFKMWSLLSDFTLTPLGRKVFEIDPPVLEAFVAETNFNQ